MSLQAASLYALVSVAGAESSVGKLRAVSDQVNRTQSVMSRLGANGAQMGRGIGQVAGGLVRIGTVAAVAAVGAVAATAKIAISFEDAFAAVEKTVQGTPAQLQAIDEGLRKLSTTIPVTFQALASAAAEAGALGVATEDIVKFTEAVARTSAATVGLDPLAASEAFGKLSTVFGLTGARLDAVTGKMVSDYERLGSALVELGRSGASSEPEIIATTKYLSGAGQAAGLSAAQVLAWSSAVTSLGMYPEAAGGALSRVFQKLTTSIATGTDNVKVWAKVSGQSVKEFSAAYERDASGTVIRFLGELGKLDKFEQARALKKAGIINQRDISAISRLSINLPVLTEQLAIAEKAWAENVALQAVSDTRFDTLKNKAILFKNAILLGAAAMGEGMLPALTRLTEKAKLFVESHEGDLRRLGVDIGRAIDEIDWTQVKQGAQSFVDILRGAFDIIKKIPAEVLLVGAGFLGLNKVSGGLLGAGLGNIIGGLGKGVGNIALAGLSKIPVVGGAIGAVTAQRVFVVNFPPGFGMGPGGPAAPGGKAPLGLGIPSLATLGSAGAALAVGFTPVAAAGLTVAIMDARFTKAEQAAMDLAARRATAEARGLDPAKVPLVRTHKPGEWDSGYDPYWRLKVDDLIDVTRRTGEEIRGAVQWDPAKVAADIRAAATGERVRSEVDWRAMAKAALGPDRIEGKVKTVANLHELGGKEDPYGFKHLKAFAMGKIPLKIQTFELERHIGLLKGEIRDAKLHGDDATVQKLQATKAGLESILKDVKAGTFKAGERAYEGALLVAAAVGRIIIPHSVADLERRRDGGMPNPTTLPPPPATGIPYGGRVIDPRTGMPVVPPTLYARGGVGLAKMTHQAMFGEAGNEGVAIIRNPREWRGGESLQVIVQPQAVKLTLNGRELARANLPYGGGRLA